VKAILNALGLITKAVSGSRQFVTRERFRVFHTFSELPEGLPKGSRGEYTPARFRFTLERPFSKAMTKDCRRMSVQVAFLNDGRLLSIVMPEKKEECRERQIKYDRIDCPEFRQLSETSPVLQVCVA
jgi:hypothetical protein